MNLPDGNGQSFENGPASQIPFVAQLIEAYYERRVITSHKGLQKQNPNSDWQYT